MNVVMTAGGGFVELQGTAEGAPFTRAEMEALVRLAEGGIRDLIAAQQVARSRRAECSSGSSSRRTMRASCASSGGC